MALAKRASTITAGAGVAGAVEPAKAQGASARLLLGAPGGPWSPITRGPCPVQITKGIDDRLWLTMVPGGTAIFRTSAITASVKNTLRQTPDVVLSDPMKAPYRTNKGLSCRKPLPLPSQTAAAPSLAEITAARMTDLCARRSIPGSASPGQCMSMPGMSFMPFMSIPFMPGMSPAGASAWTTKSTFTVPA